MTELMISSIKLSLEQPGDYTHLVQYKGSLFFNGTNSLNRIETGFLCLILLTKHIVERADLM